MIKMPQVSFIPFEQARCQNDNFGTVMKEERRQEWEAAMSQKPHTHIDENGNVITHTHDEKHVRHSHYHDPEEKKKQLNRISRAIGHLNHVKSMIEDDRDCADVLTQLSAVDSALRGLGKEIIKEHMTHCITHAIEDGAMEAVEEFQKAVQKFI